MPRRVPDITKITHLLGWRPTIDVDQIVEKVIEFQHTGARLEEATAHA
jgi:nucleoside-diphosphate-sugar epimerase